MNDQNTSGWAPAPAERYVSVWPHTLGDFEKFTNCVGTVREGVLSLWIADETGHAVQGLPPIKVYAPGYWATFEHVGSYTAPAPRETRPVIAYTAAQQSDTVEQTSELPRVPADPFAQLDPDELARTNGDVSPSVGTGTVVPYPKPEQSLESTEGPDEDRRAGVVWAAPKAVSAADTAGDPDDTDDPEPPDWDAGPFDLIRYLVGWPWHRPRWVRLPDLRRSWPRSSDRPPLGSARRMSPAGWMALSAALLLPVLVQTLR